MNIKVIPNLIILVILFLPLGASPLKGEEVEKDLKVFSEQKLKSPFLVDEKNLRKLNEVIKKRITEVCNRFEITYSVILSDNSSYETGQFEVIVSEENSKKQKIQEIKIEARALRPCETEMAFSSLTSSSIRVSLSADSWGEEVLKYDIVGTDRDWVYLTSSDINERLENMALKFTLGPNLTSIIIIIFILFPPSLILMRKIWNSYQNEQKQKDSSFVGSSFWVFFKREGVLLILVSSVLWIPLFLIIHIILSSFLKRNYFPTSVFYFGEQIREYQILDAWREEIFWVILIGGLLSFGGTLISIWFSKREKTNQN